MKCHRAAEHFRKDLVQVTLLTGDYGAIRQGNSDRRHLRADPRRFDKGGSEIEEIRPLPGVFGAPYLSIGTIYHGVSAISKEPAWGDISGVQLLSHHGLDG